MPKQDQAAAMKKENANVRKRIVADTRQAQKEVEQAAAEDAALDLAILEAQREAAEEKQIVRELLERMETRCSGARSPTRERQSKSPDRGP